METVWFVLVAFMPTAYVVLDGFDLGTGVVHFLVGTTQKERALVLRSIGPVWDGNEVWLLAAGGTLYFAFPTLYASSFSGFYLPLMMVLWLLMLRALGVELRGHVDNPMWRSIWDVVFSGSSVLLAIFFGAALWATWCAACRCDRTGISSCRCGRTGCRGRRRACSTGTRC